MGTDNTGNYGGNNGGASISEQDRQIQELENIARQREIEQLREQQQQLQRHAEEQRTERTNERSNSVNKTAKPNVRTNTRHTKGFELGD